MANISRFGRAFAATLLILLAASESHAFSPSHSRLAFQRGTAATTTTTKPSAIAPPNRFGSSSHYVSREQKTTSLSALHAPMVAMGLSKSLVLLKDASGPLVSILEVDPDAQAQFLMDVSHLLLDFTAFFKFDGKFLNHAQLLGRIAFIAIDFLPGHAFNIEELVLQLFLLGVSIQRMMPEKPREEAPIPDPIEIMAQQQEQHQRFLDLGQPQHRQHEAASIGSSNEPSYREEIIVLAWEETAIRDPSN